MHIECVEGSTSLLGILLRVMITLWMKMLQRFITHDFIFIVQRLILFHVSWPRQLFELKNSQQWRENESWPLSHVSHPGPEMDALGKTFVMEHLRVMNRPLQKFDLMNHSMIFARKFKSCMIPAASAVHSLQDSCHLNWHDSWTQCTVTLMHLKVQSL